MTRKLSAILVVLVTAMLGTCMYPTVLWGTRLPDGGWFAWFHLVFLFIFLLIRQKGFFCWTFLSSFLFYLGSLYWFVNAMVHFGDVDTASAVLVLILVCLILAFYFAWAFKLGSWVSRKTKMPFYLAITLFLVSQDALRTYFPVNGFPWPMVGYSQGAYLKYFQWLDVTGVFGLNALIYAVNGLLAEIVVIFQKPLNKDKLINRIVILLFITVLPFFCSLYRQKIFSFSKSPALGFDVALIQGNIKQDVKWDRTLARHHLNTYVELTERTMIHHPRLAFWPESAYPFTLNLLDVSQAGLPLEKGSLPIPVYLGAVTTKGNSVYNSSLFVDANTRILDAYHKRHLVPFGEYIPLKNWVSFAKRLTVAVGDFVPGDSSQPVLWEGLNFGTLICYEDIFPNLSRESVLKGANLLVNLTNDAWYGNSSAMVQHVVFSQFRALENRKYLIRSTNTGITAIINPFGEIVESLKPFVVGSLVGTVKPLLGTSFYTRYGDWVAWLCAILAGLSVIVVFAGKKTKNT